MSEPETNNQIFRRIARKLGVNPGASSSFERKNLQAMEAAVDALRAAAGYEPSQRDIGEITRAVRGVLKGEIERGVMETKILQILRDGKFTADVPDLEPENEQPMPKSKSPTSKLTFAVVSAVPSITMLNIAQHLEPTREQLNSMIALCFECASKTLVDGMNRFRLRKELRDRIVNYMAHAMAVHSATVAAHEQPEPAPEAPEQATPTLPRAGTACGITIEWPTNASEPRIAGMELPTFALLKEKRDRLITFRHVPRPKSAEIDSLDMDDR